MKSFRSPVILTLTMLLTGLSMWASLGGLLIDDLYRDNAMIRTAWFANDIVTLCILPFLILSLALAKRGDQRAFLVWLGLMLYMFYNYAFYLFGSRFNEYFLIYTALFSLSLYSLIIGLLSLDVQSISTNSNLKGNKILIVLFLLFLSFPLLIVEVKQCITFIMSGKEPQVPPLIFALDLSTVVPTTILASVLLWRNHRWGNVLAVMVLVKALCYGAVLVTGTLMITAAELAPPDPLMPFYISLVAGGLLFVTILLRDLRPLSQPISQP